MEPFNQTLWSVNGVLTDVNLLNSVFHSHTGGCHGLHKRVKVAHGHSWKTYVHISIKHYFIFSWFKNVQTTKICILDV